MLNDDTVWGDDGELIHPISPTHTVSWIWAWLYSWLVGFWDSALIPAIKWTKAGKQASSTVAHNPNAFGHCCRFKGNLEWFSLTYLFQRTCSETYSYHPQQASVWRRSWGSEIRTGQLTLSRVKPDSAMAPTCMKW